jgi:Calx-beta domain-containing protein
VRVWATRSSVASRFVIKRRFLVGPLIALALSLAPPALPTAQHDVTYITSGSPVVGEDLPRVRIRVHRGEHGLDDAMIFYGTHAGTATEGEDYDAKKGKLVMGAPTDDRGTSVSLIDDVVVEGVEDFEFRLERAEGGTLLRVPKTAIVTIADNDGPSRISFARSSFSNYENRGPISVAVVRSGDAAAETSVTVMSADDGAVSGTDYSPIAETVSFAPGIRVAPIPMSLINDTDPEETEQISLELQSAEGAALASPETATAAILDDDSTSSDKQAPVTQFHRPQDGSVYASRHFGSLHIITSDDASGVATLKAALRKRLRSGKCAWYNDKSFVRGSCGRRRWVQLEVRPFVYWQLHGRLKPTSASTRIRNYTAYAVARDEAGNLEGALEKGRNKNTFRIK